MSDTIQMRQTGSSGDYHVFAAKGDDPVKGLALHTDLTSRLGGSFEDGDQYVEVEFSEGGAISLEGEKSTGSTLRVVSEGSEAVRHAYFTPKFAQSHGLSEFPTEESFDVEGITVGISDLSLSDEETYDEEQNSTAEDAADALFGESDEGEADDSEDEPVEVSDEEIGIVE